jgi:uncharacterized membrane protein YjfL (UPF0719 family)
MQMIIGAAATIFFIVIFSAIVRRNEVHAIERGCSV